MAPDCPIRHPVWPIVALQRRVRFSAQFAGFCRIRCHQRRARRAERASFSVFVSNLDFRVPRLRPIGERALTGDLAGSGKEAARETRIEAEATGGACRAAQRRSRRSGSRSMRGSATTLARFMASSGRRSLPTMRASRWHDGVVVNLSVGTCATGC